MGRAPCCDKSKVRRGPWSPEEDMVLVKYVQKHGSGGNWITLPQKAGLRRCGKSCRLRWLNYLRPDIKHGGYTEEEDYTICTLYKDIGSKWSIIASHLPGRTDNDVKNYWNTKLKKKMITTDHHPPSTPAIDSESKSFISELLSDLNEVSSKSSPGHDSSNSNSFADWFAIENGEMNALMWELGFASSSDVFTDHESMQEMGDGGGSSMSSYVNLWSFSETMPQGLCQSATYDS
ncbi:hypothetical protein J5N97_012916 [Dioscorea zingiberensis]|uniref:Uncharacterized protein n=1 Tax=Dioscorea zingiberensis TaxID=325984 RepID=A0A9D5CRY8_9LILI|nr:hypothetical protein J5N97_012916 [Dioscorea zingiberensis]